MSWWGKLLGGTFGYLLAGPLGALIGAALGHKFDKGLLANLRGQFEPGAQERVQTAFFTALFSVMGHLAKADGRVSENEIELAKNIMQRMNLNEQMRETAIRLFNQGKQPEFSLDQVLDQFRQECHRRRNLMQMFVEILMHAAYADDNVHPAEHAVLERVRQKLGFSPQAFAHIEALVRNSRHFGGGGSSGDQPVSPQAALREAYEILGAEQTASDGEIKRAYRRLMNQHHPDKLVAKGLPEEMIRLANEKTQEIREAYELVKKDREK
ncbi:MAG: co-chaperone DjlA [bacterium]